MESASSIPLIWKLEAADFSETLVPTSQATQVLKTLRQSAGSRWKC